MADPRFFKKAGPFTLAEICKQTGATLAHNADSGKVITRVSPLQTADESAISFLDNPKYVDAFQLTKAGACVIHPKLADKSPAGTSPVLTENPYYTYALIAAMFYEREMLPSKTTISDRATVHASAKIGNGCLIEANVYIGPNAEIGDHCHIYPNVYLGQGVQVGNHTIIHAGANISHSVIGNGVIIHHGACLGQDGFGFATDDAGNHTKVPQIGRVMVEDDVEIGANSCIDRGSGHDTVIGAGTKIDNLVQIGHNVVLGRNCIIVAQVGISGSTRVGDNVMMGGQAGITGHLKIGDRAKIAAQSGVMRDVSPGMTVIGSPALPSQQHHRQVVMLKKLSDSRYTNDE